MFFVFVVVLGLVCSLSHCQSCLLESYLVLVLVLFFVVVLVFVVILVLSVGLCCGLGRS
jgi:hypothetical protein